MTKLLAILATVSLAAACATPYSEMTSYQRAQVHYHNALHATDPHTREVQAHLAVTWLMRAERDGSLAFAQRQAAMQDAIAAAALVSILGQSREEPRSPRREVRFCTVHGQLILCP